MSDPEAEVVAAKVYELTDNDKRLFTDVWEQVSAAIPSGCAECSTANFLPGRLARNVVKRALQDSGVTPDTVIKSDPLEDGVALTNVKGSLSEEQAAGRVACLALCKGPIIQTFTNAAGDVISYSLCQLP